MFPLILILLLSSATNSWAAVAAATQWEIRTTGSNPANGCGYSSGGTDYSQQASPQLSPTDLAVNEAAATTLTSTAGGFTAAMIGNLVYIASGTNFVAGFYQITAYTDTNTVTIDRDPTDADGGNGSAGVGYVGGACSSINSAVAGVVAGNKFWVQSGTYNETVDPPSVNGGSGTPIVVEGYKSSRGDEPKGADRPLIDGQSTRTYGLITTDLNGWYFKNLRVTGATSDGVYFDNGASGNVAFINFASYSNGRYGMNVARDALLVGVESYSNSSYGIYGRNCRGGQVFASYVHDNGASGLYNASGAAFVLYAATISESNSGRGIYTSSDSCSEYAIIDSLAYNNTGATSDGFSENLASSSSVVGRVWLNNSSVSNGRYAYNHMGGTDVDHYFDFNNYYDHATELNNVVEGYNDTGDADPSFTDAAGGDFTVSSSSSPLVGTGLGPDSYTSVPSPLKWNIGVDQGDHATAPGGSTTIITEDE